VGKNKMSTLREKINAEKGKGSPLTYKQGKLLYQLTTLKWWMPESMPAPTVTQASMLIDACLIYVKSKEGGAELVEAIQIWFPGFDDIKQIHVRYFPKDKKDESPEPPETTGQNPKTKGGRGKKGGSGSSTGGQEMPEQEPQPEPTPDPVPAPAPAPKPKQRPEPKTPKGIDCLDSIINAGIKNIWMVGPAGCGKTTICQETGKKDQVPVTVIPCGAGTSATTFLGYKYPEREGTPFVHAFAQEGIIVLDEFTSLEAQVAQIVNGALANNELTSTIGTFQRHENCIIIATSNTFGNGADRMYVSNNQLDASTIDRFAGGIIEIDYSKEYESQYDMEVVRYVWHMRDMINKHGLRKVASTRSIIAGCKHKAAGLDWKAALTPNWTKDEKALL
jgi:hypothetical protein